MGTFNTVWQNSNLLDMKTFAFSQTFSGIYMEQVVQRSRPFCIYWFLPPVLILPAQ